MRLGFKLAAFGIILLLAKTHVPLSNAYLSEAQTAPERTIAVPVAIGTSTRQTVSWPLLKAGRPTILHVRRSLHTTPATPWPFMRSMTARKGHKTAAGTRNDVHNAI